MTPFVYLQITGLPFARPVTALPSRASGDGAAARAITRGGLIYDLDSAALAAGVLIGSSLRQARQACPGLASYPFVAATYDEHLRPLLGVLRGHTHRFEFDGSHCLFIDCKGSGQPDKILSDLAADCPGAMMAAGIGSSKLAARAAALALMACHTATGRPMFLPQPELAGWVRSIGQVRAAQESGDDDRAASLRVLDLVACGATGEQRFLSGLPVGYLWPLAEDLRERLFRLGLKTWGEIAACAERELTRTLGPEGKRAALLARGIDFAQVIPTYTPDEIIRRVGFDVPVINRNMLKHSLSLLGMDLGNALTGEGLGGREVVLTLHLEDGGEVSFCRSFGRPRGEPPAIAAAALALLEQAAPAGMVSGMAVAVRGLQAAVRQQLSFLDRAVGDTRQGTLLETLASLERKFPGGAVRRGALPSSRRELMLRLSDPLWRRPADGMIREPAD